MANQTFEVMKGCVGLGCKVLERNRTVRWEGFRDSVAVNEVQGKLVAKLMIEDGVSN